MDKEMLCVERSKVTDIYAYNEDILKTNPTHGGARLLKAKLQELFGDKCLPDNVDTLADNVDSSEPNVESKPRFKKGDRFRFKEHRGEIYTVDSICGNGDISFYEKDEDGMNRQCLVKADYIEPYTEPQQTEENMEEKELNLAELLKGCEGEKVFLVDEGERTISLVTDDEITFTNENRGMETTVFTKENISVQPTGFAYIYPSKEAFLAHPLNAKQAWQEWAEERKPKRWRPEVGDTYWIIEESGTLCESDMHTPDWVSKEMFDFGNCFRTKSLANEAAAQIRELLMKFHEQHPQV